MDILFSPAVEFHTSQWLFLRLIAIIYFLSFWSLYSQVLGLYGSRGIQPNKTYSDAILKKGTIAGMFLSLIAAIGVFPAPFFLLLYLLSLQYHKMTDYSIYPSQMIPLLLETGFMTFLFSIQSPAPYAMVFLFWIFLFHFIFSTGIVKILSCCPYWKTFTAMDHYYETQFTPNTITYYMHKQPRSFGKFSVGMCFFIELIVPFFIFTPMPIRFVAFLLLTLFQVLILLTGNLGFFNLLTIVLCIPLLDDNYLPNLPTGIAFPATLWTAIPLTFIAVIFIILNLIQIAGRYFALGDIPHFIRSWLSPYWLQNEYGVYSEMFTTHYEIIIEGSNNGKNWKVYEFKYKAGDLKRRPKQITPHTPYLDEHMGFASLRVFHKNFQYRCWLQRFILRLLEGSPEVLSLLEYNPFPDQPPKFIRAQLYKYRFTTLKEKGKTGQWWKRKYLRQFSPIYKLEKKTGAIISHNPKGKDTKRNTNKE